MPTPPVPKSFAKSRIFWLSVGTTALNAALASLIAADGVPRGAKIGLSALAAACGVVAAALRVDDYRRAK